MVIGGGAAGMMAAISAAECGAAVTLLEPNERLGKKLNITGKGRCNVTNDTDLDGLMANIPRNGKFLYSAFSSFGARDTMAFFETLGVPLKVERGNRVFPVSDSAFDISGALKHRLQKLHVNIVRDRAVTIVPNGGCVTAVKGEKSHYPTDAAILATGGVSYPSTGSTGDGYRMAAECGHTIVEPRGSLVPLQSPDACCAQMQGLALKNVELTVFNKKNKTIFREFGEMLFTHFGVSGPLVLSASVHMHEKDDYRLSIDLKPGLTPEKLDERLLRDFGENLNRCFKNSLDALLPQKLIPVIIRRSGIDPECRVNAVTRAQRQTLAELIKHFELQVTALRPVEEAIVTAGGIDVSEVNPRTMESRIVPGLFFAGEILNLDGYTGGFNLQIAWSTAVCAANNA